ncbi:unnamed protein product [Phaedon cochleariae]|uniref:Envelope protein n=1 Tax=Phaedon cochleariae TaxID=80249 RepID=A0A9P0GQE6_PHACE|nr:unnamed protein product [Phaedon cochleariae]
MEKRIHSLISFWIFLSFVTVECLGEDYSITQITSSSGLYYEKIGDVLLSNNNWEFVTSVDYDGYLVFYEYLHTQAQELHKFCQEYKSQYCEERFSIIKTGLNRIDETDENMANFLGIKTENRRVKRFWNEIKNAFSAIGRGIITVARTVFGGGSNQPNLAIYDQQIAGLQSGQRDLENKLNQQTTLFLVDAERKNQQIQWLEKTQGEIQNRIGSLENDFKKDAAEKAKQIKELSNMLNETNNKLKEQEKKQKKLEGDVEGIKNKILKIDEQIKTISEDVVKNTKSINELELKVKLNSLSIDFGFLMTQFETEQAKLFDVIKKAKQGSLDPYVLTPLNLIEMLQEIQGHLSEDHQFPFYPSIDNARHLYKIIKIDVYFYNNKIIFIMKIPLVNYKKFGIHKITSLPLPYASNRFIFILPQEPFLIVDNSYHEYLLMSHEKFRAYCEEIVDKRYLCRQVDQLSRSDSDDDCEMKLFSTALVIPHSCNKRAIEIKQSIFLQLQKSRSWIYAAKTNESVIISCAATRKTIALQGSGFISLSENCTGRTTDLVLVSLLEFTKPVLSNYSASINLIDFVDSSEVDYQQVKGIKRVKKIISPFDFDTLEKNSFPLVEATGSLTWLYVVLPLAIIIILATVGFFVYKKKIDVGTILTIIWNGIPFLKKKSVEDQEDRLKLKVKLQNKDEKITKISMTEDPSSNDPDAEYLTVRFKVKKQNKDVSTSRNQININDKYLRINSVEKVEEDDDYLKELRKLKPNNKN